MPHPAQVGSAGGFHGRWPAISVHTASTPAYSASGTPINRNAGL